jgi:predicted site-specific integrase-resolvase
MTPERTTSEGALLLSATQTAHLLGVNPRTVDNYVKRGIIEPVRIKGSPPRYRRADVERLVERGSR